MQRAVVFVGVGYVKGGGGVCESEWLHGLMIVIKKKKGVNGVRSRQTARGRGSNNDALSVSA